MSQSWYKPVAKLLVKVYVFFCLSALYVCTVSISLQKKSKNVATASALAGFDWATLRGGADDADVHGVAQLLVGGLVADSGLRQCVRRHAL